MKGRDYVHGTGAGVPNCEKRASDNHGAVSAGDFGFIGWCLMAAKVYCIAVFDHKRVSVL